MPAYTPKLIPVEAQQFDPSNDQFPMGIVKGKEGYYFNNPKDGKGVGVKPMDYVVQYPDGVIEVWSEYEFNQYFDRTDVHSSRYGVI